MKRTASLVITFSIFLLSASCATSSGDFLLDSFLKCLPKYSQPSNPISSSIYTPNNASFSSILRQRISNLRLATPTTPQPLAIIAAGHESHVQAAILCAKSNGIQIRIRSGGHDYEGLSFISDVPYVVLDLFQLNFIDLDIPNKSAWIGAGATIGELYYRISNHTRTLAFPAGVCPTLGAGGHISGGGYGSLSRKYGLSVDNVLDAKIVDVNGKVLDRKAMGEDLFWAIRGGGGASFGVIISWKIQLVPVPAKVTVFHVQRTLEQNGIDVSYKWQYVAPFLPDDLFIRAIINVANGIDGKKTVEVSFISLFLGTTDQLLPLLGSKFPELGVQKSDCFEVSWAEASVFWTIYQLGSTDILLQKPYGPQIFMKLRSDYVKEPIPKAGIESIWNVMKNSDSASMQWNPYGGKMSQILESATPFPHRAGNLFLIQYAVLWSDDGIEAANHYLNFSRTFFEAMTPYASKSPRESFQNYRDIDIGANRHSNVTNFETAKIYGSKFFKNNFERLVQVKTEVDPENFFRHEQSIPTHPIEMTG